MVTNQSMFIRIKSIKGKEYAYLVKNQWTDKGTRQVTKKYLGRVKRLDLVSDIPFKSINSQENNLKDMLSSLISWELSKRGFKKEGNKVIKENLCFNTRTLKLTNKEKPLSIAMNEGVLNEFTIKRILNFQQKEFEHETMYGFAKAFVESGLDVPKEIFVDFYDKIK